jgi:hypothetical protein
MSASARRNGAISAPPARSTATAAGQNESRRCGVADDRFHRSPVAELTIGMATTRSPVIGPERDCWRRIAAVNPENLPRQNRSRATRVVSPAIGDQRVSGRRPDAGIHGRMLHGRTPASRRRLPPRVAQPRLCCCHMRVSRVQAFEFPPVPIGWRLICPASLLPSRDSSGQPSGRPGRRF